MIHTLDYARKWMAIIDWCAGEETRREPNTCNVFDPAVTEEEGWRLRMPGDVAG